MSQKLKELSELLIRASEKRAAITPLTQNFPQLTLKEAYGIQRLYVEARQGNGDRVCGYKMGLTSRAKQVDVQVFEPIRGCLFNSMENSKGSRISLDKFIQPRFEPEVAVRFRKVPEGTSLREVRQSIGFASLAIEILDSRFQGFEFKLPDVVADNTSAAGFIIGDVNIWGKDDLRLAGVVVKKNGTIVATGAPAAVLGDPVISVAECVKSLKSEGREITPDHIILTGGITTSVPFNRGDSIQVIWPWETIGFTVE